jgi:uncharacterized lipoprotein
VNRIASVRCSVSLLLAATLLGGCSWFHHRTDYYSKAAETRPLEVPPDLDTPVTSNELVVPQPGSGAGAGASSSVSAAPPAGATPTVPSSEVANGLRVQDSPEHTWQRVGLALERAQLGTISARDEGARTYTVAVNGLGAPESTEPTEHHWYSRILHPFGGDSKSSAPVSGDVVVKVSADGGAARVDVEGSTEAARRVLAVLRDRLS